MSNQPMCADRFFMLLTIMICMALVGQGIGLFFGAAFDIPMASYFAPISCIPFLLVSGFMIQVNAIPPYLRWIAHINFLHYSFEGSMLSIYGGDHPPLSCFEDYCHFRYPIKFLEQFNLTHSSYYLSVIGMVVSFIVIRVAGYFALRFKLRHVRWTDSILRSCYMILNNKIKLFIIWFTDLIDLFTQEQNVTKFYGKWLYIFVFSTIKTLMRACTDM